MRTVIKFEPSIYYLWQHNELFWRKEDSDEMNEFQADFVKVFLYPNEIDFY